MEQIKKKNKALKIITRILVGLLLTVCIMVIFFNVTHKYYPVSGPSMTPTINKGVIGKEGVKDGVFVTTLASAKRGDIIVVNKNYGVENSSEYAVVKRLIATGGDKIKISVVDGNYRIILIYNGQTDETVLDEPYLLNYSDNQKLYEKFYLTFNESVLDDSGFYEIPEGDIFYLGDNRIQSMDCADYGTKSEKSIIGVVDFIIYGNSNLYGQVIGQIFGW